MPSILPDYEYDIFVSYRHNDNLDGWVTSFVESFEKELRGTLKESLTIYFDKNPRDGLLETHHVDKSLEGKLKCLIFIPIISQTYCDPKSFAWQHEFVAFNKLAKEDDLERDFKLSNGNVASRILSVKIHDLDAEDTSVIETEISGVLRAIEFIYREAGVNRPLTPSDDKKDNLNNTDYRNQVNKVANAVKEIITSVKNPSTTSQTTTHHHQPTSLKSSNKKVWIVTLLFLALASIVYYFYFKQPISNNQQLILDKSIAVLPFTDMSPQKDQEYLGDGIAEEILNVLARVKDLKVIGRTSSFSYKGKDTDLKTIGEELGVSTILEGSIRKDGNKVRITAQFIKAADGSHLWSESFDRELKDVFQIQDELAKKISSSLLTTFNSSEDQVRSLGPVSNEAYNLYLLGKYQSERARVIGDEIDKRLYEAINLFSQSIELDSTFANAYAELASAYLHIGFLFGNQKIANIYYLAEKNALKALSLDPNNARALDRMGYLKRNRDWDWEEASVYYQKSLASAPNNADTHRDAAYLLSALNQKDSALHHARKALELNPTSDPYKSGMARVLYYNKNYKAALDQINTMIEPNGESQAYQLRILIQLDKEKALSLILKRSQINNSNQAKLKSMYGKDGWDAVMKEIVNTYLPQITQNKDIVLTCGTSKESTIQRLTESADNRVGNAVYLLAEPSYDPLRSEPEFEALLKRMGLDKYK